MNIYLLWVCPKNSPRIYIGVFRTREMAEDFCQNHPLSTAIASRYEIQEEEV